MEPTITIAHKAMLFATEAHKNQMRKYTGDSYIIHPAEVVGILSTVTRDSVELAIAWLHDVVEDCGVSFETLASEFGLSIAYGVMWLTDNEAGNRKERKAQAVIRLGSSPAIVQTIKVADLISNTRSIILHDKKFAQVCMKEVKALLDVLTQADERLVAIARAQIEEWDKGEKNGN